MTRELEQRTTRGTVEFRAPRAGATMPGCRGYAMKYKKLSRNLGGFVEEVLPGAVDKSLADGLDVLARYNHDDNMLLGRTGSGTLTLASDAEGLTYDVAELPDTTVGRDLAALLRRGDVSHSSFAFYTLEDSWGVTEQGFPLRSLVAVRLVDVAPVNTPAYLDTSVAVRSLAGVLGVDPTDVPALSERGELARRLARPTVIDLGRRDVVSAALDAMSGTDPGEAPLREAAPGTPTDAPDAPPVPATEHPLNERQCAQAEAVESIVETFGKYDQGSGANGAHYAAPSPFAADGLVCSSCHFYEGSRGCEVVAGDIDPGAICKLWIIPADLISARSDQTPAEDAQRDTHAATAARRRRLDLQARAL